MSWFNQFYVYAGRMEFRRIFKKEFYGYCYGSGVYQKQFNEFSRMYDMGNEL
jgi:hypothetical protein